jgi:hypothetical protein
MNGCSLCPSSPWVKICHDCHVESVQHQSMDPIRESYTIVWSFNSAFNGNLLAMTLCGFFRVKIKFSRRLSALPVPHLRFPLHRSKAAENGSFPVQNYSQSLCVTVTSTVKFLCFEIIATGSLQKEKPPPSVSPADLTLHTAHWSWLSCHTIRQLRLFFHGKFSAPDQAGEFNSEVGGTVGTSSDSHLSFPWE